MKINALLVISRVFMMSSDSTATLYLACALLLSKQWMIMWLLVKNLDVPRKNLTLENLYYVSLLKFTRSLQCKRNRWKKLESMGCGSACRSCACLKQIEQLKIAYTNGVVDIKSTAKPMQRRSHGLSMRLSMWKQSPNRMDERGQRKAIKHAQSCVIGDANRWMLQKEFHHLYPFVAATIFAMPNKTGAAARSTSQSHMARNRSGGSSFIIY